MNYKREIKALELLRHQFIWIFNHPALSSVQSFPLSHSLVSWHFTVVIAKHVVRLVLIFMRSKFIVHLNLIKFNVHLKQSSRKYRSLKPETPKPPIHKPCTPYGNRVKFEIWGTTPFKFIKSYEFEIVFAKSDDFRVTQLGCVLKFMHK